MQSITTRGLACVALSILLWCGCTTNDFRVVNSLHVGMTSAEAHANIAAYGFHRAEYLVRPGGGWSEIETSMGLPKRAAAVEGHLGKQVASAEFYPVFHGMLGYGHLFLFYDENNRLLEFYRVNIN